jgi:hypothetical protein
MSSKDKIKSFLFCKGEATNAEIAELLHGQPGQLSTGQRLREIRQELRAEGGDLECKEVRPGIYLYRVIKPKIKLEGQQFVMV